MMNNCQDEFLRFLKTSGTDIASSASNPSSKTSDGSKPSTHRVKPPTVAPGRCISNFSNVSKSQDTIIDGASPPSNFSANLKTQSGSAGSKTKDKQTALSTQTAAVKTNGISLNEDVIRTNKKPRITKCPHCHILLDNPSSRKLHVCTLPSTLDLNLTAHANDGKYMKKHHGANNLSRPTHTEISNKRSHSVTCRHCEAILQSSAHLESHWCDTTDKMRKKAAEKLPSVELSPVNKYSGDHIDNLVFTKSHEPEPKDHEANQKQRSRVTKCRHCHSVLRNAAHQTTHICGEKEQDIELSNHEGLGKTNSSSSNKSHKIEVLETVSRHVTGQHSSDGKTSKQDIGLKPAENSVADVQKPNARAKVIKCRYCHAVLRSSAHQTTHICGVQGSEELQLASHTTILATELSQVPVIKQSPRSKIITCCFCHAVLKTHDAPHTCGDLVKTQNIPKKVTTENSNRSAPGPTAEKLSASVASQPSVTETGKKRSAFYDDESASLATKRRCVSKQRTSEARFTDLETPIIKRGSRSKITRCRHCYLVLRNIAHQTTHICGEKEDAEDTQHDSASTESGSSVSFSSDDFSSPDSPISEEDVQSVQKKKPAVVSPSSTYLTSIKQSKYSSNAPTPAPKQSARSKITKCRYCQTILKSAAHLMSHMCGISGEKDVDEEPHSSSPDSEHFSFQSENQNLKMVKSKIGKTRRVSTHTSHANQSNTIDTTIIAHVSSDTATEKGNPALKKDAKEFKLCKEEGPIKYTEEIEHEDKTLLDVNRPSLKMKICREKTGEMVCATEQRPRPGSDVSTYKDITKEEAEYVCKVENCERDVNFRCSDLIVLQRHLKYAHGGSKYTTDELSTWKVEIISHEKAESENLCIPESDKSLLTVSNMSEELGEINGQKMEYICKAEKCQMINFRCSKMINLRRHLKYTHQFYKYSNEELSTWKVAAKEDDKNCTESSQAKSASMMKTKLEKLPPNQKMAPFVCSKCCMRFKAEAPGEKHISDQHSGEANVKILHSNDLACGTCGTLVREMDVAGHMKKHRIDHGIEEKDEEPKKISNSSASESIVVNMPKEDTIVKETTMVTCIECGERYVNASARRHHMLKHLKPFRVECRICNETFSSCSEMNTHQIDCYDKTSKVRKVPPWLKPLRRAAVREKCIIPYRK